MHAKEPDKKQEAHPVPIEQPSQSNEKDDVRDCLYCGPQPFVDYGEGWPRCGSCKTL